MRFPSALAGALCGATLGAALLAPAARAHDDKHEQAGAVQRSTLQGTVEAVSPRSITLEESDGRFVKVELDQETQYDNGGKTGAVTDLRVGMTITVRGELHKDGTVRAESVRYGQPG